jgi:two-component system, NarL family, nitrate/nitrite response regulator NarL
MTQPSPSAACIRVLIVEDHLTVLWGLERLVESAGGGMIVVGKATSAEEAIRLAAEIRPDVVLFDIGLADRDGIEAIPELIGCSGARVLVLTGERSTEVRERAVLAGACGVVGKEDPPGNILRAIEKVWQGELWLERSAAGRVFMQLARNHRGDGARENVPPLRLLTPREREIVRFVSGAPALTLKAIAGMHHMSESTLRNHLTSIYEKLHVASRLELYVYANKHALAD